MNIEHTPHLCLKSTISKYYFETHNNNPSQSKKEIISLKKYLFNLIEYSFLCDANTLILTTNFFI